MSIWLQNQRIFIDASYSICSGKNSGIERVVRNLLRECRVLAAEGKVCQPTLVVSHQGRFYELQEDRLPQFQKSAAMQANVLNWAPDSYTRSAQNICQMVKSRHAQKWLLPQPGHLGVFKLLHTLKEASAFRQLAADQPPIEAQNGDLFILPDAYWVNRLHKSVWPATDEVRNHGASIATLIYDLIPLTHPEFVRQKRHHTFKKYLEKAICKSDMLIAISNTVREEVEEFIDREMSIPSSSRPATRSFTLGAELNEVDGFIRQDVINLFSGSEVPYLTVSTFDPRKNHSYLLDAFDLIWNQAEAGEVPASSNAMQLCLVGRFGSRCNDILHRIAQHPLLGKNLHLFDDLSDAELHYCYAKSKGVIFPSIVEGFGLPIVESLWHGKKTFASDTPIHREVGQQDCSYFSLECPSSLVQELRRWEAQPPAQESLPVRRPTTWADSCQQFLGHCSELMPPSSSETSKAA